MERNYEKAFKLLKQVYSLGYTKAADLIGKMYLKGLFVAKNENKARDIFQFSAKKGSTVAKKFLNETDKK